MRQFIWEVTPGNSSEGARRVKQKRTLAAVGNWCSIVGDPLRDHVEYTSELSL